jgi:hypothetical protein
MSPLVAWVSRNSGAILFVLLLSVAMIEAVAMYAAKRRTSREASAGASAGASPDAAAGAAALR